MIAKTLVGRLLCAANLAYGAQHPYVDGSGFTASRSILSDDGVNAATVGTNQDGVVVAFRGTLSPIDANYTVRNRLADWIDDFRDELVPSDHYHGLVHKGFALAVESLWDRVAEEIEDQLEAQPGWPQVYFTGHSKGGGMAPLAACRWAILSSKQPMVTTFAAPKCGDVSFARNFDFPMTRYEYQRDVVPFLPPGHSLKQMLQLVSPLARVLPDYDYHHVGQLKYLDTSNEVITPDAQWDEDLLADGRILEMAYDTLNLGTVVRDHHITQGSGYFSWLCPEIQAALAPTGT